MTSPSSPGPAPERSWLVYAQVDGSGPVVIGTYPSESEQRRAYRAALQRLADGGYSEEVKDFALGEDPAYRQRAVMDAMHPLIQEVMQL